MKIKKNLCFIVYFLALFSSFNVVTYASNGEHSTHVQYNVSKDNKYKVSIEVIGPGTVYDGTAKLMQGTMIYELGVGEIKTFKLIPNKNSKIKHVIWNNKDITNKLLQENGAYILNIQGISDKSSLLIEFIKDNHSNISNKLPNTGYKANKVAILLLVLGIISITIGIIYKNKRYKKK